jgi:hypothetical protein
MIGSLRDALTVNRLLSQQKIDNNYSDNIDQFIEGVIKQLTNVGYKTERFGLFKCGEYYEGLKVSLKAKDDIGDYIETVLVESNGVAHRMYALNDKYAPYKFAVKNYKKGQGASKFKLVEDEYTIETKYLFKDPQVRAYETLMEAKVPYFLESSVFKKHLELRNLNFNVIEGALSTNKELEVLMYDSNCDIKLESLLSKDDIKSEVLMPIGDYSDIPVFIEAPLSKALRVEAAKFKAKAGIVISKLAKLPLKVINEFRKWDAKLRRAVSDYRKNKDEKTREKVLQDEIVPLLDSFWGWATSIMVAYGALAIPFVGPIAAVLGFVVTKLAFETKDKKVYQRSLKIFDNELEIVAKKLELAQMKNDENAIIALTKAKQALSDEREKHLQRTSSLFN